MCLSVLARNCVIKFVMTKIIFFALFFTKQRMMALYCHQYHSRMEAAETRMNIFSPTHSCQGLCHAGTICLIYYWGEKIERKRILSLLIEIFSKRLASKDERALTCRRWKHEVLWNRSVLLDVHIEQLPWNRFAYYLSFWYICFVNGRKQMLLAHPQFWMNDLIWWWPTFWQIYFYSVLFSHHPKGSEHTSTMFSKAH